MEHPNTGQNIQQPIFYIVSFRQMLFASSLDILAGLAQDAVLTLEQVQSLSLMEMSSVLEMRLA